MTKTSHRRPQHQHQYQHQQKQQRARWREDDLSVLHQSHSSIDLSNLTRTKLSLIFFEEKRLSLPEKKLEQQRDISISSSSDICRLHALLEREGCAGESHIAVCLTESNQMKLTGVFENFGGSSRSCFVDDWRRWMKRRSLSLTFDHNQPFSPECFFSFIVFSDDNKN